MKHLSQVEQKIVDLPQLLKKLHIWRFKEQKIVFTNGCFDLLHKGHLHLLIQTADLGDKLIIGLNSDSSVQKLKGPTRPVQNEQTRASLLAAFSFVAAVVIFGAETPFGLIQSILPDVLVKGNDYKKEEVVGADIVTKAGGEVMIIHPLKGYSTTDILSRYNAKIQI